VRVWRSKTDQLGEGAAVAIPFGSHPEVCPVRAFEAWHTSSGVLEGTLFRSVDRHGRVGSRLDRRDVARSLKEMATRAGLVSAPVSGALAARGTGDHRRLVGRSERAMHDPGPMEVVADAEPLRSRCRRLAG